MVNDIDFDRYFLRQKAVSHKSCNQVCKKVSENRVSIESHPEQQVRAIFRIKKR